MKSGKRLIAGAFLFCLISACSNGNEEEGEENEAADSAEDLNAAYDIDPDPLEIGGYGDEVGLAVETPVDGSFATETSFMLEGSIDDYEALNDDYLWLILDTDQEDDTAVGSESFEYFVPIDEGGSFSEEITLHAGEYNHHISVRVPSNDPGEENTFYEAVSFDVHNANQEVQREIEYTLLGQEYGLQIEQPVQGYTEAENVMPLEGKLPGASDDHLVMIQVEKEGEESQFTTPVKNEEFSTEVPLNLGEGLHTINVMVYIEEEDLYYDAAYMLADASSDDELVQVEANEQYYDYGIELVEPTNTDAYTYEGNEYRIAGEIDPDAEGADEITHMIVTTELKDETANYYLPVEDYAFDDTVWFRFGEGEYDITVSVPEPREEGADYFQFFGVAAFSQEVVGAEDLRTLLPSVGIESDHPRIKEVAEKATEGVNEEKEKAEAVYEYVATNISYDVEKLQNNLFEMDDSALKTLETKEGVCQDYVFLAVAMLRALGIEANYVAGNVGAERHAWVDVKVEGGWLEMDPTWGAGYIENDEFVAEYNEDYFDPEEEFLEETHTRTEIIY